MPCWQPKASSSLTLGSSHCELKVSSEQIQSEELSVSKKDLQTMKFRLVQVWLSERILAGNAYCYRVSRNFEHTLCFGWKIQGNCSTIGKRNLKMDSEKAVIIEVKVDTLLCNSKMLISKWQVPTLTLTSIIY